MEVFRASGAGGQHINKTSSAVRLIHEPTGLVVSSQEERSQLQNRERAMSRLKAMVAAKIERRSARPSSPASPASSSKVGCGSQIRSYVVQPYQLVKDLRTEYEVGNVRAVLDGDIEAVHRGVPADEASERRRGPAHDQAPRREQGLQRSSSRTSPSSTRARSSPFDAEVDIEGRVRLPRRRLRFGQVDLPAADEQGGAPGAGPGLGGRQGHRPALRSGRCPTCAATSAASSRTSSCSRTRRCSRTSPSPSR